MTFSPSQLLVLGAFLLGAVMVFIVTSLNGQPYGLPVTEEAWLKQTDVNDPALAFVNGWPIRRSQVLSEAAARGLIDPADGLDASQAAELDGQVLQTLVEDLVDQQLLGLEARRLGLARDPQATRLLRAREDTVLSEFLLGREVDALVTPAAVRQLYDEQAAILKSSDEVRARHILVKTRAEADAAVVRLDQGEAFAAVARQISIDPGSKEKGGDLGYFIRRDMVPAFSKVAFSTKVGAVSKPFESEFGWHIVKVEDRRKPDVPTFEELQSQLVSYQKFRVIENLLMELRGKATIDYVLGAGPEL